MKIYAAIILSLALVACPAAAEVWTQTMESPEYGAVFTVEIGQTIASLESVALHVTGYDVVGGYSCDGMDGTYYVPEFHVIEGDFGQGIEGDADDLWMNSYMWDDSVEGPDFDYTYEFDVSDPVFWSFLDDGPADFVLEYYTQNQDPSGGYCFHIIGEFRLDSATLIVTYNETIANDESSWDALKALYR